jgi:hypothetical protein
MNKKDFDIIIGNTPYETWGMTEDEALPVSGAVIAPDGGMYDQHITEEFTELADVEGLYEEAEGMLSYEGGTAEELIEKLCKLGFDATYSEDLDLF